MIALILTSVKQFGRKRPNDMGTRDRIDFFYVVSEVDIHIYDLSGPGSMNFSTRGRGTLHGGLDAP